MKKEISKYNSSTVYNISFCDLADLYDYLKSNPKRNSMVFERPASIKKDIPGKSFYGYSLDESINFLLGGYKIGYNNFLQSSNEMKNIGYETQDTYRIVRSIYGGVPIASLVAMNVPDCMLSTKIDSEIRTLKIRYNLGYPAFTKENQIINRGLATMYIIQALEAKGYLVSFDAFQLSRVKNEIIHVRVTLKRETESYLNISSCYFPIRSKEFFRRILFRVFESSDVTLRSWGESYGHNLESKETKEFYNAKNDLVISSPFDMGIEGNNIYEDTLKMIQELNIESEFDIDSLKRKIRKM